MRLGAPGACARPRASSCEWFGGPARAGCCILPYDRAEIRSLLATQARRERRSELKHALAARAHLCKRRHHVSDHLQSFDNAARGPSNRAFRPCCAATDGAAAQVGVGGCCTAVPRPRAPAEAPQATGWGRHGGERAFSESCAPLARAAGQLAAASSEAECCGHLQGLIRPFKASEAVFQLWQRVASCMTVAVRSGHAGEAPCPLLALPRSHGLASGVPAR